MGVDGWVVSHGRGGGGRVPTVSWDKRRRAKEHRILEKQMLRGADD